jgi:parallel beta-helix repeat protein
MNKLTLAFLIAAFLLLIAPVQATIYVGGEAGVPSISEAIEKATENETIIVCEGIYRENVAIDKPLILKASGNVTIEAADDSDFVVWIEANNVVFSGFSVKGGFAGIHLGNVLGCRIENNSVFENDFGIGLISSSGNSILNNTACGNCDDGIYLQDSSGNEVKNNTACGNCDDGIYLQDSSGNEVNNNIVNKNLDGGIVLIGSNNNKITNNTAFENDVSGIHLQDSSENKVNNNIVNNNLGGIILIRSNNSIISNNTICENGERGIDLEDSSGNEVCNNIVNKNLVGIVLMSSNNNIIKNNTACENGDFGIQLQDSSGNEVCNNIFNTNLDGIVLIGSNNNIIKNNTACENEDNGFDLEDSSGNEVCNNIVNKNLGGILLIRSNNNKITNNTACENEDNGIHLQDSSWNEVCNNIVNKNLDGILLIGSNNNIIKNNTICENGNNGIQLQDSSENEVCNNIVNKNLDGILLQSANNNVITKNNIVNNKNQAEIYDVTYTLYEYNNFDRNYWSDYTGEDKNKNGIGDKPYEIDEANKDRYPYMSYSGWLNVVITPEFWYFFVKKGEVIQRNFSIENRLNRAIEVEVVFDENLGFEEKLDLKTDGTETNKKTVSIPPKSTKIVTLRLNTTNLEGYILRKVIFNTEEYTKTTLVNGFVQPKIHNVKVEGVDFHRNVVKGQINPFIIILRNYGDKDEFKVKLRVGSEEKSRTVYLNETETRTIPFEIDTSNLPLGINKGQVVVSKDERLDYLNLTMFVASKLEASTLVVTNLTRFKIKFNESEELRSELIRLTHHPAVNGILLDVSCNYSEFDSDYSKANELCEAIKKQIEEVISEYPNIRYLIIVGDDHVIPFYRERDGTKDVFTVITGLPDEGDYSLTSLPSNSVKKALSENNFLTDDFYANLAAGRVLAVGRLVEKPDEIIKAIDMFFNYYQLTPTNVFVTGYDFMYDGSAECFEEWRKRIETTMGLKCLLVLV